MLQETVRCPYCVLDSEFRPMFRKGKKSFVCVSCGHSSIPDEPYAKCPCSRCRKLNRLANRLSREHQPLAPAVNS